MQDETITNIGHRTTLIRGTQIVHNLICHVSGRLQQNPICMKTEQGTKKLAVCAHIWFNIDNIL